MNDEIRITALPDGRWAIEVTTRTTRNSWIKRGKTCRI